MKKAMIALTMFLIACTSLSAQPQGQRGPRGGVNLDEIPGITADQKEKIGKIQSAQREEMQKLFGENRQNRREMTQQQREEMRKKMEESREKTMKEIEGVLTPDQFKVYQEKIEARQRQMRQGQGNREGRGPQARLEHRRPGGREFAHRGHRMQDRRMNRPAPQPACTCSMGPSAGSNS